MRHILLTFAITAASFGFNTTYAATSSIDGWDESLPVTAEDTAAQIEAKVSDLTFEDEGNYVGGQSWDYKLIDYNTYEDNEGDITYSVRVQYRASMTLDYGRTESTRVCQSLVTIDPKLALSVGKIECPDMP